MILTNDGVNVYPNPIEGLLAVDIKNLQEKQEASLVLFDLKGQLVVSRKRLQTNNQIDFTNTPLGTYVLRVTIDKKTTESKIIKI
ncbi:MAG: T9SS type A sorting domain-containing protein [Paludibacteraceae bacterium]|nr:T9SS type A sorting domain-containing protein [Paludibacteraceae bacterium]